jgi:endonuclease III
MKKNEYAQEIYRRLKIAHPDAHCELNHSNPFELLLATILSAQCTDARVNQVTPDLFKRYPTPQHLAQANLEDIEEIIKSVNFFRNKAKALLGCSQMLLQKHRGVVPQVLEDLTDLPGVGRKTANVVLGNAFNINHGIVVDTHVKRTTFLLGLTKNTDPEKVEKDLMKIIPRDQWTEISHLFIFLGRRTCNARKPQCELCYLKDICPSMKRFLRAVKKVPRDTK